MKSLSDEIIIKRLQSTSEKEVNQIMRYLYERLYQTVHRYILKNNGQDSEVSDVFQDGLIALYKLALQKKIDRDTNIEGYLFSICRNLWLKELKKKKRTSTLTDEMNIIPVEDMAIKKYFSNEQETIFRNLLKELGDDCYKILNYFYYERRRMKEIIQLMGISNEQVAKNKKSKCMKKLRDMIGQRNINRDFFY